MKIILEKPCKSGWQDHGKRHQHQFQCSESLKLHLNEHKQDFVKFYVDSSSKITPIIVKYQQKFLRSAVFYKNSFRTVDIKR